MNKFLSYNNFEVKNVVVCIKRLSGDTDSNLCIISNSIFYKLKLTEHKLYTVHVGLVTQDALIQPSKDENKNIYLSENLFNKLSLLENLNLNIWKSDEDIYIGPVVGILFPIGKNNTDSSKLSPFIKEHIKASQVENCIGYLFSSRHIDWINKRIKGFTYIPDLNKWDYCWLPLPNVLYDRVVGDNKRKGSAIMRAREKFKTFSDAKFINNLNMIGKWEAYKVLAKYEEPKEYLPETIAYSSFEDVIYMINKYNFIFMKSQYGCGGKEVFSLERVDNRYKLSYFKRRQRELFLDDLDEVCKFTTKFVGNKHFIIQHGIRLLTFNGCNMDIRMYIVKNELGVWESVFNGARVSKGNFKLTNANAGGTYAAYEQLYPLLKEQHGLIEVPSTKKLSKVTILLAHYLEQELGSFGEIGFDIGIDVNGRIWMLEANSKPSKKVSPKSVDINGNPLVEVINSLYEGTMKNDTVLPQALAIFKYGKFLSGINSSQVNFSHH